MNLVFPIGLGVAEAIYQQLRRANKLILYADRSVTYACEAEDQTIYYLMNLKIKVVETFDALEADQVDRDANILYGTGGRYFYSEGFNEGAYGFRSYLCGVMFPEYRREHFSQASYL